MTDEKDEKPVTFDSYGGEGQDPQDFVEDESEPPDAENED